MSTAEEVMKGAVVAALHKRLNAPDGSVIIRSVTRKVGNDGRLLGFLGDHAKLVVEYAKDGDETGRVEFFAKSRPVGARQTIVFNERFMTFEKEALAYGAVMKRLDGALDCPQWHAECYYQNDDVFIFEDLTSRGYSMGDLAQSFDVARCKVALSTVARMHSASIAYEEKQSKPGMPHRLIDEFGDGISRTMMKHCDWFKLVTDTIRTMIKLNPKYDAIADMDEKFENAIDRALDSLRPSHRQRNVFVHSDLWNNNLMFRHDAVDRRPVECIMVDFQISRVSPPMTDVVSLLCNNMDVETLADNLDSLLEHYYNEVSTMLNGVIDPVAVLDTWRSFRASYDAYKPWGLLHALLLQQFVFLDGEILAEGDAADALMFMNRADLLRRSLEKRGDPIKRRFDETLERFVYECVETNEK